MSRYITINEAISVVTKQQGMRGNTLKALYSAPTIDIVRCKECKHWERLNYEAPKEGWCDDSIPYSDGRWVDADDFCSYGERNDNE